MIKLEENCEMKTVSIIDCIPKILQKIYLDSQSLKITIFIRFKSH